MYMSIYIQEHRGPEPSYPNRGDIPLPGGTLLLLVAFLYIKQASRVLHAMGPNEQV